jgi:hypothetical protein
MGEDSDSQVTERATPKKARAPRQWSKASTVEKIFITRIDGFVNQKVALKMLGVKDQASLYGLVERGQIETRWWDERTPLYVEASITAYLEKRAERELKRTSEGASTTQ